MGRKKKTEANEEDVVKEAIDAVENLDEIPEKIEKELEGKGDTKIKKISVPKISEETEEISGAKKSEKTIEEKKKALLERAKKLKEEKIEGIVSEELKEKVKIKKKEDTLLPLEDYVKSGIYIGTKVVTPDMRKYVYRRRADGLAILNTDIIDKKIKEGADYLAKFDVGQIIVVCKRQAGWRAVKLFSELTGVRVFTKKYPAGILTNTQLPDFFETELVVICDPWLDKNALNDAVKVNNKIMIVADTNNFTKFGEQIIIGNNKSAKSLGLIFYLLTKRYMEAKGIKKKLPELDFWEVDEEEARKMRIIERSKEAAKEEKKLIVEEIAESVVEISEEKEDKVDEAKEG